MTERRTTCPDCEGVELNPIMIVDATNEAMGAGVTHVELSYASANATRSHITRTVRTIGNVKAFICPDCSRILLYGQHGQGLG